MLRRTWFACLAAAIVSGPTAIDVLAASNSTTMTVQVRVYRQPRPGKFEFYTNTPVELYRNGKLFRNGVTGTQGGQKCMNFEKVPADGQYWARARVNGQWINQTSIEVFQGRHRRIDCVVP